MIDDPQFPVRIQAGGRNVGWHLREQCVVRILFESGGRISEVVGLTLGDWAARGLLQETQAFSKGSHGKRVKFLRFSAETAKLLRRYFDTERCRLDSNHYRVGDYLQAAREKRADLYEVPLFLSPSGHPAEAEDVPRSLLEPRLSGSRDRGRCPPSSALVRHTDHSDHLRDDAFRVRDQPAVARIDRIHGLEEWLGNARRLPALF